MKFLTGCLLLSFIGIGFVTAQDLAGAWKWEANGQQASLIFTAKHFVLTYYDLETKKFESTRGGAYRIAGGQLLLIDEFNTKQPEQVSKEQRNEFSVKGNKLVVTTGGEKKEWGRVDNGTPGKLSGAWLITGRMVNGEQQKITPGARRTMKILSGTRFQWIAYNEETKEFFGTGGGTYTTDKGKYTESIEFFSRDASRVGMQLSFDFALEDGNWRHKGFSSKGDPIDEVWTRRELLGL
ncbi:MAG TPA: membrane or secreted protein [Ohtaekwangia sp.]|nr:membrane or secreted protein [Ohtaekwangia sp.]